MTVREKIINKAAELRSQGIVHNPFVIAEEEEVLLYYNDEFEKLLGFYVYMNGCNIITLNGKLSAEDTKLVLYHELGHLFFHRESALLRPLTDTSLFSPDKTEYEANLFAAECMIEDSDILEAGNADFYSLAKMLSVPPELLTFKLICMRSRGFDLQFPSEPDSRFLLKLDI